METPRQERDETGHPTDAELRPTENAVEDLFLGAGVCGTQPQSAPSLPVLPDTVPIPSGSLLGQGSTTQEIPLDVPLSAAPMALSDSTWTETQWRQDGVPFSPYVYPRPARLGSRFAPSVTGSGVLNAPTMPVDPGRSMRNAVGSVCTSQAINRNGMHRREEIYRLSQNPWGPSTVFGPRSIPSEMHSWQIRDGESSYGTESHLQPGPILRDDRTLRMYSKYQGPHGVVRRVRDKIADVGGRICQSFLVWVLFVAAVAGMEGFKDKTKAADVDWSESEADSENEPQSKFNVLSFKG